MFPVSCAPFLRFGTLEPAKKRLGVWKLPTWNLVAQRPLKRLRPGKPSGMGARTFRSRHLGLGNNSRVGTEAKVAGRAVKCSPAAFLTWAV